MSHTYHQVLLHIVFSTKDRRPLIQPRDMATRLYAYMATVVRNEAQAQALRVNGPTDHVHMLLSMSMAVSIADLIRTVKSTSTLWTNASFPLGSKFAWQTGYGAFSVSPSLRDKVLDYIARQEEHHRRMSFQEEFVALLRKAGIVYDERFVFD